jgi:hypothetical protein
MIIIFTVNQKFQCPKPYPMSWYHLLGFVCIISMLLPVGVIIFNRFYMNRSLSALFLYFLLTAVYNMMDSGIIPAPKIFQRNFGILTNYLDVPLMMSVLLFFCPSKEKKRNIFFVIGAFILYEIIITINIGYRAKSVVYIMGPGIVVVLAYTFYLFLRQVKFSIMHRKNQGRIVILTAILFAYSCYSLIYYFYYIQNTPYKEDTLLLYHLASTISSVLISIGLHLMRKRMKELQSLRVTRKELAMFFGH